MSQLTNRNAPPILHRKTTLSGEVFKESFTDLFQTSLEQVGFFLKPHRESYRNHYKTIFWKGLRLVINRRLPYFTQRKVARFSCFSNSKLKLTDRYFCGSYKQSNPSQMLSVTPGLYNSSYNFRSSACKQNQIRAKLLTGTKLRFLRRFVRQGTRFVLVRKNTDLMPYKASYKSPICKKLCTCKGIQGSFLKGPECHSKIRAFWKRFEKTDQLQKSLISLNVRVGDYLSSGDKIGERNLCKRGARTKASDSVRISPQNDTLFEKACLRGLDQEALLKKLCTVEAQFLQAKVLLCKNKNRRRSALYKAELCTAKQRRTKLRFVKGEKRRTCCFKKSTRPIVLSSSGRVIAISKTQLILQKTQPVLFYSSANLHVKTGNWVKEGSPILTLTHQTLITGDIVQGIPRIEQLFEAFTSPPPAFKDKRAVTRFKDVHDTLHSQVRDIFRKHWIKSVLPIAVRKSLEEIQYLLVEMIQKVYLSQGVLIADKHIEIIIRQIASKGQILDSGTTGLFLEEILPIRQIENANLTTPGKKCLYVPAIMGLTAAALNSDSFISAASFQETTRVLSRDAVVGKSDFLRGLKEKVVIGDLISAGTGLDIYFIYTTMLAT